MSTASINLGIDELRVAAEALGATLPAILDEYDTADPGADAAGRRSLVARDLAALDDSGLTVGPALAALLRPATDPRRVVELDRHRPAVRCATTTGVDGATVSFVETGAQVWSVRPDPGVVPANLSDLVSDGAETIDGRPTVALPRAVHDAVADSLAAGREDDARRLLAGHPADLTDCLCHPAVTGGRLSRAGREPDGTIIEQTCVWIDSPAGAWTVFAAEPADDDVSLFVPVDAAGIRDHLDVLVLGPMPGPDRIGALG